MPEESYTWLPNARLLSLTELSTLVDAFIGLGVEGVRLTGGEPLLRTDVAALIEALAQKPQLVDVSLTTNGVRLGALAAGLAKAGLKRLTVSLDTLRRDRFSALTRRDALHQVLDGLEAARALGLPLKIDTVVMRGVNDDELVPLLQKAKTLNAELRFIEYMDVGGATRWSPAQVVSRADMLRAIEAGLGPLRRLEGRGSAPAERFVLDDGTSFGIIASTTQPFCGACDRVRVTADGTMFTCLYATSGLELAPVLRSAGAEARLPQVISSRWAARSDRGAQERLALRDARGPLFSAQELRGLPQLEMHTRGG